MKMKLFLLLMFGGLCKGDLLNREYLPPPGAKISGGSDGAVDLPLETPFETSRSSPKLKPIQGSFSGLYRPEDYNVYRTTSSGSNQEDNFTAGTQQPETVNISTTTTSFAFTQTTTFSPFKDEDCKAQQCTSNQYTTSQFPISPEQTGADQQIPFRQQPQANVHGSVPQFQSPGLDLTTHVPFSSGQYGSNSDPNQGVSQTFTSAGPHASSIQPFSPVPGSGKSPATFNNGYLPEGTAPPSQFPVEQKNYGNNRPGESTSPQFPQDKSLSTTSATTTAPPVSFIRPGFGIPSQDAGAQGSGQYSPISASDNIPANVVPPGSQSVFPSTSSSQYPYEETFGNPHETSSGFPSSPINGNTAVISGTSSGILPTGKPNQFPSVQLPGVSSVVGSASFPSTDSPQYNQPIFGQRPGISSEFHNVPMAGITSVNPGVTSGVLQTARPSQHPSVSPNVTPSVNTGSLFSSTPTPEQQIFGQRPDISSGFSKVLPSTSAMIPGSGRIPSDGASRYPSVLPSGAGGTSSLIPNDPSQTEIQQVQPYYRPKETLDNNAMILKYDSIITPEGYFSYNFDTSNGIHADETGDASDGVKAEGSFSYTGDDGQFYSVTYTADENGYQPKGYHLPTPPPIPEAIQRVIEKSALDKAAGIIPDQGFYDEAKYGYKKYQGKPGQGTSFQTQVSSEVGPDNIHNIAPGRGLSSSEISHNLPSLPYGRTQEDETFSQTTLRPNYENKYEPINQGVDRKITSQPPKYLPEPSQNQYPQTKSFDYKPQGIISESDESRGEMKPGYIQGQSTPLIGSSDQPGLRVPGDQSFPIKKIPNINASPTTTSPNIFEDARTPPQNIRPFGEKYDQFGRVISNTLPTQYVPGSVGTRRPTASPRPYERPLDDINIPVTSEGKIPDKTDHIYKQFTQMNGPPGIGVNLPSDQVKYTNVQQIQGTQTPSSNEYTVPVKVQYEDGVYRDKPQIKTGTSTFTTIRPTSYSSNGQIRVTSAPDIVRGEPTYEKQNEFYQRSRDDVNRPVMPSEGQVHAENVAPGKTGSPFIPSSYVDFPQRQQTSAIARPYDRTKIKPTGYKYNVPSQRFDYGMTQRPQPGKIPSFGQRPTMEFTSENVESASTITPKIFNTSTDVYPSSSEGDDTGITARPVKKPGRPSPGSVELFNVTPDTLDSTVVGNDFVTGKPIDGTISTSKPVTTSRGSTRYKTEPSRIETSTTIPGQSLYGESSPLANTQGRQNTFESQPKGKQYPSQPTTTAHPSRFGSIQSEYTTSKPVYNNQFTYSENSPQPITPFGKPQEQPSARPSVSGDMFLQQEEGIYGPAPTISGSSDFVQEQPSTQNAFQVPQGTPQRGYPGSQFRPSTTRLEDELSKDFAQVSQHPSTIRPFESEFSSRIPTQPRVSGYPTTQRPSYTTTGPVQYNISRPGNTEQQSTLTPTIEGQNYPVQYQEIDGRTMGMDRKDQGFAVEPTREFGVQPKLDKFGTGQKRPDQFLPEHPRPGQFAQRKPGQFESNQQQPSKFEQRRPGNVESDLTTPSEFKQQKLDQFGQDQRGPGLLPLDQQRPGILLSEQQKQGPFGSDRQQPSQLGLNQQKPGPFGLDQQKLDKSDTYQRKPGSFALDQQRPGQLLSEQQIPRQFGSDFQQPDQFGTNQTRPGQYEEQKPVQFGANHHRPGPFGLNQQKPGESDTYQQKPGAFALNQQRPEQLTLEEQKQGQFGSEQQQPNQFEFGQHRQTGSQQPGQLGTDQQRPIQFGTKDSSFSKVKGEVFSPSRKPPSYDPESGYHY